MQIPLDQQPQSNPIRFIPSENKPGKEARASVRKKFPGKVRISGDQSNRFVFGRVFDVSMTGASVVIEDILPWKKVVKIDFDIFHNGKRFVFSMQAVPLYNILMSGAGYKCGFQFGPPAPEALTTLGALMESDGV